MSSTLQNRHRRCTEYYPPQRTRFRGRRDDDRWFDVAHADECGVPSKDFDVSYTSVLKKALDAFPSIVMDENIICGTPRIAGTRIPVYMILDAIRYYGTVEGALKSYPSLTVEQVKDAVSFAGFVVEQPIEYEFEVTAR